MQIFTQNQIVFHVLIFYYLLDWPEIAVRSDCR